MNWFHLLIYITTNLNNRIMYIYTRTLREERTRRGEKGQVTMILCTLINNLNFVIENCINKKKKKKKTIILDIKL